ncbi:MAG: hypothetical protein CML20_14695 [Rheinheimera sp.]|nr:hypothetical protein [Rheinheimera sp.]
MLLPKQLAVSLICKIHSYVCALPGSGKTYVNTELCSNLLESEDVRILNATFTRNAAGEMKSRMSKRISPEKLKRIKISTLDSIIVEMAKAYFAFVNKKMKLLVGPEYHLAVMRVVNELNFYDMEQTFEILDFYLSAVNDIEYENDNHRAVVDTYKNILQSKSLPTYDLKSLCKFLVKKISDGEIKPYAFSHIIVDEFQDTGQLQYEWLKLHGSIGNAVIIGIGDDDQSLYRFAGSLGHANFINLKKNFNADGFTLDTCFRCAPKILKFAESVITYNKHRVTKEFNSVDKGVVGEINVYSHPDPVNDLISHIKPGTKNTAILCRTNRLINDVEVFLVNEGIDYQRMSGSGGLFSDFNVLAYVKLIIATILNKNPSSLIDVFGWLKESESNLLMMESYVIENNIKKTSQLKADDVLQMGLSSTISAIIENQGKWRSMAQSEEVFKCQKAILTEIAYSFPDERARKRVFGFSDFVTQKIKGATFKERVERLEVMLNKVSSNSEKIDREKVTIGTMHASKGLEWSTVWILDASEGKVPAEMKESVIESKNNYEMHIEDERRLFYVATTRAEHQLNINYSGEAGMFLSQSDLSLCKIYDQQGKLVELSSPTEGDKK